MTVFKRPGKRRLVLTASILVVLLAVAATSLVVWYGRPPAEATRQAPTAMGNELAVFTPRLAPPASRLDAIAISPDAKLVAIGTSIGIIKVWKIETGELVAEIPVRGFPVATCLAFSADGKLLAIGKHERISNQPELWQIGEIVTVESGSVSCYLNATRAGDRSPERPNSIAFSPNGKVVAWCDLNMAYIQEFGEGNKTWPALEALDLRTQQVSKDWSKEAWGGGQPELLFGTYQGLAFSPDSKTLAVGGVWGIALWDVASRKLKSILVVPSGGLPPRPDWYQAESLSFSPDGSLLAAGSRIPKGYVPVWEVATAKLAQKVEIASSGAPIFVAFSPDGKTLAVAPSTVELYEVGSWKRLFSSLVSRSSTSFRSLVFSSDGQRLAIAESDGPVRVWELDALHKVK